MREETSGSQDTHRNQTDSDLLADDIREVGDFEIIKVFRRKNRKRPKIVPLPLRA